MTVADQVLRELHRAAVDAGRPGIAIPSRDLDTIAPRTKSRRSAEQALQRLLRSQRILRARKDLLVLPDATGLLNVDLLDLVAAVAPEPYLVTAGRALEHHELTDQHFFGVVVLLPHEMSPLEFRGQRARFMRTDPTNIWGLTQSAGPHIATPERALVDAINHPRYGVSLTQALDSMILARRRNPQFLARLLASVERYGAGARAHSSKAAARRVGLIVERLFGADAAAPFEDLIGTKWDPVLLRPGGRTAGELDPKWRVKVNASLTPERSIV